MKKPTTPSPAHALDYGAEATPADHAASGYRLGKNHYQEPEANRLAKDDSTTKGRRPDRPRRSHRRGEVTRRGNR